VLPRGRIEEGVRDADCERPIRSSPGTELFGLGALSAGRLRGKRRPLREGKRKPDASGRARLRKGGLRKDQAPRATEAGESQYLATLGRTAGDEEAEENLPAAAGQRVHSSLTSRALGDQDSKLEAMDAGFQRRGAGGRARNYPEFALLRAIHEKRLSARRFGWPE